MHISGRTVWRGLVALALVAVVVVAAVAVRAIVNRGSGSSTSQLPGKGTPISAAQAWGQGAITTTTVNTQLFNNLTLTDFAPDGSFAVGITGAPTSGDKSIVRVNVKTGSINDIVGYQSDSEVAPVTDGHFIAWLTLATEGIANPTGADSAVYIYNISTQQVQTIPLPTDNFGVIVTLDNGSLIWEENDDIGANTFVPTYKMITLATGKTKALLQNTGRLTLIGWPWFTYNPDPNSGAPRLHAINALTGQDLALPSSLAVPAAISDQAMYGIYGATEFGKTIAIIQKASPIGTAWHDLFHLSDISISTVVGATDAYFIFNGYTPSTGLQQIFALNLATQRLVVIDSVPIFQSGFSGQVNLVELRGTLLMYTTQANDSGSSTVKTTLHFLDLAKVSTSA